MQTRSRYVTTARAAQKPTTLKRARDGTWDECTAEVEVTGVIHLE
jgi:hypothetical protein